MISIRRFCVRWLTAIVAVAVITVPVSQATADSFSPTPASGPEVAAAK